MNLINESNYEKSDGTENGDVNENNDKEEDRDIKEYKDDEEEKGDKDNRDDKIREEERDDEKNKENEEKKSDSDDQNNMEGEYKDENNSKIDIDKAENDEDNDFSFLYNNDFNVSGENEENIEQNNENEDDHDFNFDELFEKKIDVDQEIREESDNQGAAVEESEPDFDELFENKFDVDQEIREESDDQGATVEESEPDFDELFENKFDVNQEIREESDDQGATVEDELEFDELFEDNDWLTTKLNEDLHEIPELMQNDDQNQLNQIEKNFDHLFNDDSYLNLNDDEVELPKNSDVEKDINKEQQIEYFDHLFANDLGSSINSDSGKQQEKKEKTENREKNENKENKEIKEIKDTNFDDTVKFQEMDKFLSETIDSLDKNNENDIDFILNEEKFKNFENFFKKSIEYPQFFQYDPARINSESLEQLKKYFQDFDKGNINSPLFEMKGDKIFFYPGYMRCSNLKVKYLEPNAIKGELHNDLKNIKYYLPFSPDSIPKIEGKEKGEVPKVLIDILKTTSDLHKMWQILEPAPSDMKKYDKWFESKPNHNVIEKYLYNKFPQIAAIETPVWSEPLQLTGHVDFLMFDDKTLYVMDYKPEAAYGKEFEFIKSIPQVSMYGKLIKKFVPEDLDVKCVSFSKESGWIYDPNKIEDVLPSQIEKYIKKPEFIEKLAWIPLAKDKPAPFETMAQSRINEYLNSILDDESKQPYRKKFRKVLHNLKDSDKIPTEDMTFLGKALKKNFNLTKENVSEYIKEYKKNFKSKELYTEFLNNIGKGMLCPECSQIYSSSKYAALTEDSLSRLFHYYKEYTRARINNENIDRTNLEPFLKNIFDQVSNNSIEQLKGLDKIWINSDRGAIRVPIEDYTNISSYVYDKMEKGEDLTKIFQNIKKISSQDSLPSRIKYFKDRIRKFFNEDRERALNLYNIPLKPKKISVAVDKDGNVKISKYKHLSPCTKEIEGLSSRKFFIKSLEENKSPKEIGEYLKKNIPKNDLIPAYDNFIHQFRDWAKDNREYLLHHYGIPIDVQYQIIPNSDFNTQAEIRIQDFCAKRLKQGIPLETFAKTALYQVPENRRKLKWRQITKEINSYAQNNPELFHKQYGIRIDEKFSAADYLSSHMDIKFKKQKRTFKSPTKYSIEGLPLKQFIQSELNHFPKQEIKDLFNKISLFYPKKQHEIRTTIGRCAKAWISDNSMHVDCKKVANSLEKFRNKFNTSNTKMQLLKDILENKEIEQCKQNYTNNTLKEKGTSKTVNEHTLNTTISRMKRIIKHRTTHPSATFDDLKLISKKSLSKSALNMILSAPIQDLKKLKIIEKKKL